MTAQPELFAMTDLGEELAGPNGAERARQLQARLEELMGRVQARVDAGVPFGRLEAYSDVAKGLAAARSIVILAGRRSGSSGRDRV